MELHVSNTYMENLKTFVSNSKKQYYIDNIKASQPRNVRKMRPY